MSDHAKEFLNERDLEIAEAEQKRFHFVAAGSFALATIAAVPMFLNFTWLGFILMGAYMPMFAPIFMGMTSPKWYRYFGERAFVAVCIAIGGLVFGGMCVTVWIAGAFHVSSGMYG